MTKSKITLFTSPTQKVIIYLDPKKGKTCVCKSGEYKKISSTKLLPLEGYSSKRVHKLKEHPFFEEDRLDVNQNFSAPDLLEKQPKAVARFTPTSYSLQEAADPGIVHEVFEKQDARDLCLPKLTLHTHSVFEKPKDSQSAKKENVPKMFDWKKDSSTRKLDFKKKSRVNTESQAIKTEVSNASLLSTASPTFSFRPNAEREPSALEIDNAFVQNVANIIKDPKLSERKKKLDELLRNLSSLGITNASSTRPPEQSKPTGWFLSFKRQKKAPPKKASSKRQFASTSDESVPFFNKSFYHYRAKSRLEGLTFEPHRVYYYGEKGSGFQSKGGTQDFYELRSECLSSGRLFEDPEFPPTNSSLFFSQRPDRRFEWKRPGEIVDNPQLFVEGFSRFDVQQGELGDCWLLAAVANLTLYRRLFFQIVPDDQSFDEEYAGIFHFRFWQYGRWIDVVIDDRLPTYRGELVFLHSTEANEFWSALLEKAYAKLHGSYEALKGGSTCEAMEDFTGGVTEMYEMNAAPPNLFKIIVKAYERWSLMGCSIEPDPDVLEAQTQEGLIRGHAYSITKVQYVNIQTPNVSGKIPLLRLRNPWGNESEWNGAWSDNAPEWQYISDDQKQELGLNFDADGEFWMSFKDFQTYFNRLEICNLNPDSLSADELTEGRNKKWVMSVFEGEWVRGVTAGGCRNFLDTFFHNPQYRVTLDEVDEGDEEDKCTVIVALMQKNRRQMRRSGGIDLLTIGFAIYHLPYPDRVPKPLDLNFFKYNASVARSPSFINLREVSCRFKLPKGTYCIVPSTFDPNEEGEFLLRVFSEHQNNMEENDQEIGLTADSAAIEPKLTPIEAKEDDLVLQLFKNVAGTDGEVDWKELQEILNYYTRRETRTRGFSKDVCRSMIAMLDVDRTGKLNFEEFKRLWTMIRVWKSVFKRYDKNRSGTLTGFELRDALNSAGYSLNNHILNILGHRYGNKDREIEFDDFIMCAVKLKVMIELFTEAASKSDKATFTMEDWIETTLYA